MLSTLRHHSGKKTGHFPNGLAGLIKYWMSHCDVLWTPSHNDTQSQDNWDPKLSYITCGTLRLCKNENAFCYVTSFTRSLKINSSCRKKNPKPKLFRRQTRLWTKISSPAAGFQRQPALTFRTVLSDTGCSTQLRRDLKVTCLISR